MPSRRRSRRAAPASSSSSTRSRRRASSATPPRSTASAGRATSTTSPPDAQGLFPTDYGGFASGLVKAIEAVGGDDLVEQVFAARRRQIGDRIRRRMAERLPDDATARRSRPGPRRAPGRGGLPRRGGHRRRRRAPAARAQLRDRQDRPPDARRRATPSWRCSRSSSGRASCASRTSPRATAAAPTWSSDRGRTRADRPPTGRASGLFALHDLARAPGGAAVSGTSETFGTNDAAIAVAGDLLLLLDRQDARAGPSVASSSRM